MRSEYADEFNHDDDAAGYDADVCNSADPIRTGYEAAQQWTIKHAAITARDTVLDLGAGTGNTSQLIAACRALVCVDVSSKMLAIAKTKLAHLPAVSYVSADILEYFDRPTHPFDAVVSAYCIHHLTADEKPALFNAIYYCLKPGGRAAFADLMFENSAARSAYLERYRREEQNEVAEAIEEEFFWLIDNAATALRQAGFECLEVQRFSDLSWGVAVRKPRDAE